MAGAGGAPVVIIPDELDNRGFEDWAAGEVVPSWAIEGTDGSINVWDENSSRTGFGRLGFWLAVPYTTSVYQELSPLPNGTYTFGIWIMGGWVFEDLYLFARGCSGAPTDEVTMPLSGSDGYTEITFSGISVTNNACTIGVYAEAGDGGEWVNFDDATFTLE